jgi:large subunit ribosomal protein L17
MVSRMRVDKERGVDDRVLPPPRKVYPEEKMKREMHYYDDVDYYRLPNPVLNRQPKVPSPEPALASSTATESLHKSSRPGAQIP